MTDLSDRVSKYGPGELEVGVSKDLSSDPTGQIHLVHLNIIKIGLSLQHLVIVLNLMILLVNAVF
jgi:hypothetical protein